MFNIFKGTKKKIMAAACTHHWQVWPNFWTLETSQHSSSKISRCHLGCILLTQEVSLVGWPVTPQFHPVCRTSGQESPRWSG